MKKVWGLALLSLGLSLSLLACGDSNTLVGQPTSGQAPTPAYGMIIAPGNTLPPTPIPQEVATTPTSQILPTITAIIAPTATATALPPAPTDTPLPAQTATSEPTTTLVPEPTLKPITVRPTTTNTSTGSVTKTVPPFTLLPTSTILPTTAAGTHSAASLSEVVRGPTGHKRVAITLDAGADSIAFPRMIAALNQAHVKITFFLTGMWAQQNPIFVQQMVSGGFEIGNHSWDHPDFTTLTDAQARDEIAKTDSLISKFTGHSPQPLWRFPYGSRNTHLMQLVNSMGYRSIYWTIDSLDSVGEPKSAQFLIDRITKQTDVQLDGEIILMHIGNATTADALPAILQNLQQRGFQVVPISQLLGS